MNRPHATETSVCTRIGLVTTRRALTALGLLTLCLFLPVAASAQYVLPDPPDPPDPPPGPFCPSRNTTGLAISDLFVLQDPVVKTVRWTRTGNTFDVTVKLRAEHRYGSMSESCMYDDGLFTSFTRSVNVAGVTPQSFMRETPTTAHAFVTVIAANYPTLYSFNIKYQENVGAFSLNFNPMRKKKLCVDLPRADGPTSGDAPVRNCSE